MNNPREQNSCRGFYIFGSTVNIQSMKLILVCLLLIPIAGLTQMTNYVILDSTKTYIYSAIFVHPNGDTLTNEKIVFKPTGELWHLQEMEMTCLVEYFPVDSISIVSPYPSNNQTEYISSKEVRVIENSERVLMYSFRDNQYVYTDIAPVIEVKFNHLAVGEKWSNIKRIKSHQPTFKYDVNSEYEVSANINFKLGDSTLENCWVINAKSQHKKLGDNFLEMVFHKEYGFVEMNYSFHGGTKIFFRMIEVIKT